MSSKIILELLVSGFEHYKFLRIKARSSGDKNLNLMDAFSLWGPVVDLLNERHSTSWVWKLSAYTIYIGMSVFLFFHVKLSLSNDFAQNPRSET